MRPRRRYQLFGLSVLSDLPLPFTPADGKDPVEVDVVEGPVIAGGILLWRAAPPDHFACWRHEDAIVLSWPDVRFAVRPDRVVVDAADPAGAALLIPAVWSIVLAARGHESLHGCAVERGGRAVAVLGNSGAGKSTAALALLKRGWRLVTDDLLAFDAARRAVPGPPFLRLAPDRAAGRAGQIDQASKFRVAAAACPQPVPLTAVVVLADGHSRCLRLTGAQAVSELLAQAYAPVLTHPDQARRRFDLALDLVGAARIYGAPPRSLTAGQLERIAEETTP